MCDLLAVLEAICCQKLNIFHEDDVLTWIEQPIMLYYTKWVYGRVFCVVSNNLSIASVHKCTALDQGKMPHVWFSKPGKEPVAAECSIQSPSCPGVTRCHLSWCDQPPKTCAGFGRRQITRWARGHKPQGAPSIARVVVHSGCTYPAVAIVQYLLRNAFLLPSNDRSCAIYSYDLHLYRRCFRKYFVSILFE